VAKRKPEKSDADKPASPPASGRPWLGAVLRWAAVVLQVFLPFAWAAITMPNLSGSSESRQAALPLLIVVGVFGPWIVPGAWAIARPSMRTPTLLAAASGLTFWFTFAPVGLFPLGFFCLAPWCLMTRRTESWFDWAVPTIAFIQCFIGGTTHWLNYSTELGWSGMIVATTLYYLVAFVPLRLLVQSTSLGFAVGLPPMWTAVEYLRASWSIAFPWVFVAHGQAPFLPFIQFSDLIGAYGVSALVLAVNGAAADALVRRQEAPAGSTWRQWIAPIPAATVGTLVVAAIGYGLWRMAEVPTATEPGPLVLTVQTNIPQRVKESLETDSKVKTRREHLLDNLSASREGAVRHKPDLIVWPETSTPFPMNAELATFNPLQVEPEDVSDEAFLQQVEQLRRVMQLVGLAQFEDISALGGGSYVLVGNPGYRPRKDDNGKWVFGNRNAATLIEPPPGGLKTYNKIHLVPWGEFIPGKEEVPWLYNLFVACAPYGLPFAVDPGTWEEFRPFELTAKPAAAGGESRMYRFAVPICYETSVPQVTRRMVYDETAGGKRVDFLVNISNDGWFEGSAELELHTDVARFRAIEHRIGIVRSVNTGISGFIDPCGRLTGKVVDPVTGSDRLIGGASAERVGVCSRVTVYSRVGDVFVQVMAVLAGVLGAFAVWRKSRMGV
jgi:apolipoprotein N-acyltransferase